MHSVCKKSCNSFKKCNAIISCKSNRYYTGKGISNLSKKINDLGKEFTTIKGSRITLTSNEIKD